MKIKVYDHIQKNWRIPSLLLMCKLQPERYIIAESIEINDVDGTEIFEGDVLYETKVDGSKNYYKIWRERGGLVINQFQDDFKKPTDQISFWEACADMQTAGFIVQLKVCGNRIDNPEYIF